VDTATVIPGVETIDVDDKEGDAESPGATAAPSAGIPRRAALTEEQAVEMPRRTSTTKVHPWSSADTVSNLGSHKRARKTPPKPCKPGLRSATKYVMRHTPRCVLHARCASVLIEVICLNAECPRPHERAPRTPWVRRRLGARGRRRRWSNHQWSQLQM
jgi:hypothetical protein